MKKNNVIAGLILLFVAFSVTLSGCLDFLNLYDDTVIYESHPVKLSYDMEYGYLVDIKGIGDYKINYDCDKPELILGSLSYDILYKNNYQEIILADNEIIQWQINRNDNAYYKLGIETSVNSQSFLVSDLTGSDALTIQGINILHPNLVDQYCNRQIVNNSAYIDPDDPTIKILAQHLFEKANTDNSFIIAKEIFSWLKQNTSYTFHNENNDVQPAFTTYQCKTGDCDDLSYLFISICRSLEIPARYVRGILIDEHSAVSHAWAEVFVGGSYDGSGWIPVECAGSTNKIKTEINQNFGVESAGHLRLFTDDGSNESMNFSLSGPSVKYGGGMNVELTAFINVENYEIIESAELEIINNFRSYN